MARVDSFILQDKRVPSFNTFFNTSSIGTCSTRTKIAGHITARMFPNSQMSSHAHVQEFNTESHDDEYRTEWILARQSAGAVRLQSLDHLHWRRTSIAGAEGNICRFVDSRRVALHFGIWRVTRERTMIVRMLQAKLHRVTVTHAVLDYEGSCGIDEDLLVAAGLREFQYIELYNVTNGERFSTYIIKARRGSGEISLNGAAARKAAIGDLLIICAYSDYSEAEAQRHRPKIVLVDQNNRPRS